jgi:GT2 family glycosyltransferase
MDAARTRPRVSVVIVVKDGRAHLGDQLRALDAQENAPAFEVVVADNGSRDGTPALVRDWILAGHGAAVNARLVDAGRRAGIPYARNEGACATRGEVIAFCDADDVVAPGWVAAMSRALASPGLAGGRRDAFEEDGTPRPDASAHGLTSTAYLPFAATCNLAVTRDCFFAVGGFDESLPPYGFEDVDFCWRAQLAGHPLRYAPDAVIRFTVSGKVRAVRKEFLLAKARMAIVHRHPQFDPTPYSLRYCLADLARSLVRLPGHLRRPRVSRTREVRWVVDAVGRLAGYWHYSVRGRDARSVLLEGDPLGLGNIDR